MRRQKTFSEMHPKQRVLHHHGLHSTQPYAAWHPSLCSCPGGARARELAESLLDIGGAGGAAYAQSFVVVLGGHTTERSGTEPKLGF